MDFIIKKSLNKLSLVTSTNDEMTSCRCDTKKYKPLFVKWMEDEAMLLPLQCPHFPFIRFRLLWFVVEANTHIYIKYTIDFTSEIKEILYIMMLRLKGHKISLTFIVFDIIAMPLCTTNSSSSFPNSFGGCGSNENDNNGQ